MIGDCGILQALEGTPDRSPKLALNSSLCVWRALAETAQEADDPCHKIVVAWLTKHKKHFPESLIPEDERE